LKYFVRSFAAKQHKNTNRYLFSLRRKNPIPMTIILSDEQCHILQKVKSNRNVMVDAVAGTGKTTLILAVAKESPEKMILQMTYNSSLRLDVKSKIHQLNLTNIKVHTFHSLAVRYYLPTAFTDTEIRRILLKNTPPNTDLPKIDILVLDECQDMTFLYFQFIIKFVKDMNTPTQLLVLGDYMQGLYEFKGADTRFLTMADQIWQHFPLLKTPEFEKCTMRMSFRITNQICSFVNDVMLGESRMSASRDDQPVVYFRHSTDNIHRMVCAEICKLLQNGTKPSEIFILGNSVKGVKSNIRKLENKLVENGIPCHVPMMENDKIDDRVIGGKIVFTTFHAVKGRQRKYVFIMGFDNRYSRYIARNTPADKCPNTLYVAATRASGGLYLLENGEYRDDRPLKFLKKTHVEMKQCEYIDFRGLHQTNFVDEPEYSVSAKNPQQKQYTTPSELIRYMPESVIESISPILDRIFIVKQEPTKEIEIPSIVETAAGFFEEVSDLNGIAIPCIYYDYFLEKCGNPRTNILTDMVKDNLAKTKQNEHGFLKELVDNLPETCETTANYLYLANISLAVQEKLYFKLKQIENYDWLDENLVSECKERMDNVVGVDCVDSTPRAEETIISEDDMLHQNIDAFFKDRMPDTAKVFRFNARVDLISDNTVWELKCTSKLSIEHKLQLVIYAWLWQMRADIDLYKKQHIFTLFNIRTGEILGLDMTNIEDLHAIMLALIRGKYTDQPIRTDEEFLRDCGVAATE
jgi:hypothetical protein